MTKAFAAGGDTAQTAFNQVVNALINMKDPVAQNAAGVALFGTQFEDLGVQGIEAFAHIGTNASLAKDSLGEINKIKYDSIGSALQGIGRNIQMELFVPFQEKVMPKMNEFAQWIQEHMPQIKEGIQTAVEAGSKVFDKLTTAVKFVTDHMNIFLPVLAGVTSAIVAQNIIAGVTKLYDIWKSSTLVQTIAQQGLNAALKANPIGLVITAIGLLVTAGVYLWKNWDTVKAKAGELWSGIKSIFGKIGDFIGGVWDGVTSSVKGAINSIIRAINGMIGDLNKIKFKIPDWVPGLGGQTVGFNLSKIPMLAKGTEYFQGGLAIVGEKGPELVNLPKGSKVNPADETARLLKGGNTINIYPQKAVFDEEELSRTLQRLEVLYGG